MLVQCQIGNERRVAQLPIQRRHVFAELLGETADEFRVAAVGEADGLLEQPRGTVRQIVPLTSEVAGLVLAPGPARARIVPARHCLRPVRGEADDLTQQSDIVVRVGIIGLFVDDSRSQKELQRAWRVTSVGGELGCVEQRWDVATIRCDDRRDQRGRAPHVALFLQTAGAQPCETDQRNPGHQVVELARECDDLVGRSIAPRCLGPEAFADVAVLQECGQKNSCFSAFVVRRAKRRCSLDRVQVTRADERCQRFHTSFIQTVEGGHPPATLTLVECFPIEADLRDDLPTLLQPGCGVQIRQMRHRVARERLAIGEHRLVHRPVANGIRQLLAPTVDQLRLE